MHKIHTQPTGNLIYSTDKGRVCPSCGKPKASCTCRALRHKATGSAKKGDGVVRLHRERKGRKGKGVTLVAGLELPEPESRTLAKKLKSSCGVGGTVKDGVIELQTADREKVKTLLEAAGYTVKLAGS